LTTFVDMDVFDGPFLLAHAPVYDDLFVSVAANAA